MLTEMEGGIGKVGRSRDIEAAGHRKRLQDTETKKEIQRMQGTASEVRNMYFKIRDTKKEKEKH